MGFERFTRIRTQALSPKVSILNRGQVSFNKKSVEDFNIAKFTHAVLFFDRDSNKIGIKLTSDAHEEGAIKISQTRRPGQTASLSAKSFLGFYGIDYSKAQKYDVSYNKEDGLLIINLSQ